MTSEITRERAHALPVLSGEIFLSVVIPSYNEQSRIADTLFQVKKYLKQQNYNSEVIVIDDGSVDTTAEVVRVIDHYHREFEQQSHCVIATNAKNTGKGFSVARGCKIAQGRYVLVMDADSATPISEFDKLLPVMREGDNDLVIGTRNLTKQDQKPWSRQLLSLAFKSCVRLLGFSHYSDTQCGFKLYRKEAAHSIVSRQRVSRWCFDLEHLVIAEQLGYSIASAPVAWHHMEGSKINPVVDSCRMLLDLLRIRLVHQFSPIKDNREPDHKQP